MGDNSCGMVVLEDPAHKTIDKETWVTSHLTEILSLTPINQTAPHIYTRIVYGFPFSGKKDDAENHVFQRLREPFLR